MNLSQWTPTRIPISHQLPPMPHEGCPQIPREIESGWQAIPKVGELQAVKATRPMPSWLKAYFTGNEKNGYTCRAPWMKHFEPLKTPKCPACPNDRNPFTTSARLAKNILADLGAIEAGKKGKSTTPRLHIGSRIHDWECIATDGYRAVFDLTPAIKGKAYRPWNVCDVPSLSEPSITLSDPSIFLAIKRLATLIKDEKNPHIILSWNGEGGWLTISACNSYNESGIESFACTGTFAGNVKLDPNFVIPMLGTWPLSLYHKDNDKGRPVIFMPATAKREFMYVLMPVNI